MLLTHLCYGFRPVIFVSARMDATVILPPAFADADPAVRLNAVRTYATYASAVGLDRNMHSLMTFLLTFAAAILHAD